MLLSIEDAYLYKTLYQCRYEDEANFSICLKDVTEYVKNEVDVVIGEDLKEILKIFEKIYYCENVGKL